MRSHGLIIALDIINNGAFSLSDILITTLWHPFCFKAPEEAFSWGVVPWARISKALLCPSARRRAVPVVSYLFGSYFVSCPHNLPRIQRMSYWCNGFPDQSKTALQLAVSASDTPSAALWLSAYCQGNLIQQSQQYAEHINLIPQQDNTSRLWYEYKWTSPVQTWLGAAGLKFLFKILWCILCASSACLYLCVFNWQLLSPICAMSFPAT